MVISPKFSFNLGVQGLTLLTIALSLDLECPLLPPGCQTEGIQLHSDQLAHRLSIREQELSFSILKKANFTKVHNYCAHCV